jgi:hypothetical protein
MGIAILILPLALVVGGVGLLVGTLEWFLIVGLVLVIVSALLGRRIRV